MNQFRTTFLKRTSSYLSLYTFFLCLDCLGFNPFFGDPIFASGSKWARITFHLELSGFRTWISHQVTRWHPPTCTKNTLHWGGNSQQLTWTQHCSSRAVSPRPMLCLSYVRRISVLGFCFYIICKYAFYLIILKYIPFHGNIVMSEIIRWGQLHWFDQQCYWVKSHKKEKIFNFSLIT